MNAAAAAAAALAEVDLENGGGGGGALVESGPYPADKRLKEKQPFTWLAAAPYIAVMLAGAALFAAGMAVLSSGVAPPAKTTTEEGQPYHITARGVVGTALYVAGMVVGILGFIAAAFAGDEWELNLRRFGPD
jgi:hypothetical protein